jgi:hypothetical protein
LVNSSCHIGVIDVPVDVYVIWTSPVLKVILPKFDVAVISSSKVSVIYSANAAKAI